MKPITFGPSGQATVILICDALLLAHAQLQARKDSRLELHATPMHAKHRTLYPYQNISQRAVTSTDNKQWQTSQVKSEALLTTQVNMPNSRCHVWSPSEP